jgi:hypothetical protein
MVPASESYYAKAAAVPSLSTRCNIVQPIGISTYRVTRELPEPLQAEVPSIEDLQEVVEKLRKELNEARQAQETDVEQS